MQPAVNLPAPSLPATLFLRELEIWRDALGNDGALAALAAAHSTALGLRLIPSVALEREWSSTAPWLRRLVEDLSEVALIGALAHMDPKSNDKAKGATSRLERLRPVLGSTAALFQADADKRSAVDPETGLNRYGCAALPLPGVIRLSACSANQPTPIGFAAAESLRLRLIEATARDELSKNLTDVLLDQETRILARLRVKSAPWLGVALAASGTDAARLVADAVNPVDGKGLILLTGAKETGRETPKAVSHIPGTSESLPWESVDIRDENGAPIADEDVNEALTARIAAAHAEGLVVVLHVLAGSKTGLIAPSIATVKSLLSRFHQGLTVVADLCQTRWDVSAQAYLDLGCAVVATGSKFFGGPAFSGIALTPAAITPRLNPPAPSVGVTLRWEAALAECGGLEGLRPPAIAKALGQFHGFVRAAAARYTCVDLVPDESPAHVMTFRVRTPKSPVWMSREGLAELHHWLAVDASALLPASAPASDRALAECRCLLGQPVAFAEASALRIAINAADVTTLVEDPHGAERLSDSIETAFAKIDLVCRHWR